MIIKVTFFYKSSRAPWKKCAKFIFQILSKKADSYFGKYFFLKQFIENRIIKYILFMQIYSNSHFLLAFLVLSSELIENVYWTIQIYIS